MILAALLFPLAFALISIENRKFFCQMRRGLLSLKGTQYILHAKTRLMGLWSHNAPITYVSLMKYQNCQSRITYPASIHINPCGILGKSYLLNSEQTK